MELFKKYSSSIHLSIMQINSIVSDKKSFIKYHFTNRVPFFFAVDFFLSLVLQLIF